MEHSFDVEFATVYGVAPAIILKNIAFWIKHNESIGSNERDGFHWTYCSVKAWSAQFPYFGKNQIANALKRLKDDGFIITGNYNKSAYDHTTWYTLTDKGKEATRYFTLTEDENGNVRFAKNRNLISHNGDSISEKQKSIIYNNTILHTSTDTSNTDINTDTRNTDRERVLQIVNYLNEVTGKKYRPTSDSTIKHITARLKEGYTVEDFKYVIKNKWDEWHGTTMEKYVRPETLFTPSKFEAYLNETAYSPSTPKNSTERERIANEVKPNYQKLKHEDKPDNGEKVREMILSLYPESERKKLLELEENS